MRERYGNGMPISSRFSSLADDLDKLEQNGKLQKIRLVEFPVPGNTDFGFRPPESIWRNFLCRFVKLARISEMNVFDTLNRVI